jgi:hypothetical protein
MEQGVARDLRPNEPGVPLEVRVGEPGVALEVRPVEPGVACEVRPVERGIAREVRPAEVGLVHERLAGGGAGKVPQQLGEQLLGERDAGGKVHRVPLAELLVGRGSLVLVGVGQAWSVGGELAAEAGRLAGRPVDPIRARAGVWGLGGGGAHASSLFRSKSAKPSCPTRPMRYDRIDSITSL